MKWVFPYISWYANTAYCHSPFGYSGITVLWKVIFIGLPLFCGAVIGIFSVPIGIKGLIDKQFPPRRFKVYKPTKIITGWKAKAKSLVYVFAPLAFVIIAIWGSFQIDSLPNQPDKFDYSICSSAEFTNGP